MLVPPPPATTATVRPAAGLRCHHLRSIAVARQVRVLGRPGAALDGAKSGRQN